MSSKNTSNNGTSTDAIPTDAMPTDAIPTDAMPTLRLITYLSPGVPIEVFQTYAEYLESTVGVHTTLTTEWRYSSPPMDRVDPFTADIADIGFMCGSGFLDLQHRKNKFMLLCEAAPLHRHPKALNRPVYFSDVVIRAEDASKYKTFHDLRGSRLAYNDRKSLSGSIVILQELKRQGLNANFFADVKESGGHLKSIELVLNRTVDTAAIDSNTLKALSNSYPEKRKQMAVVTSLGPMPIYATVFNSRMSVDLQKKITQAFLNMSKSGEWKKKLDAINVSGFIPIDESLYNMETEINDLVKNMSINTAYY